MSDSTLTQQSYPQSAHVAPERHDPTFAKRVMDVLLEHKGERVHLQEIVGGDSTVIHEVVEKLRRIGWVIEAEGGVPGYTLVDMLPPDGWIRLKPSPKQAQLEVERHE